MNATIETRGATEKDYPQIYELLDKVMYSTSEQLKGRYRNYPGTKPEHSRITVVDGKVVSHVRLYMAEAYYGNATIKIGFIGDVCTDPEHRRKGYGAACLRDGIRYFAEKGCHISMIFSGVLGFYASEGWRLYPVSAGVVNVEYLKPVPQEGNITVRRFERASDLAAVAEVYEKFNRNRFLPVKRTIKYWQNSFYWLHGEREENFYVAEKNDRIIGYSRISGNQVTEMCYLPEFPEAVSALWDSIVKWIEHWARRGVLEKELHVSVPTDHALYPILKRVPLFHEITYYTMLLRMISFQGLLQALIPFFSEHVTEDFSQAFDLDGEIVTLSRENGRWSVSPGGKDAVAISSEEFFTRFLGLPVYDPPSRPAEVQDLLVHLFPLHVSHFYYLDSL